MTTVRGDKLWQPSTFAERGVAVPFTTPALSGTRARMAAGRVELVVPHPAGVRGVYVLGWAELGNFCAPTLHDQALAVHLGRLAAVTPGAVRAAARAVAREGAAGWAARQAVEVTEAAERRARVQTNVALLRMLVARDGGGQVGTPVELEQRAKAAIRQLAPELGRSAEAIYRDIETLAGCLTELGIGVPSAPGTCARVADMIGRVLEEVQALGEACPGQSALAASLIGASGTATLALARQALAVAMGRLVDIHGVLADWARDSAGVTALLARPEWLLNGWGTICLVWDLASDAQRRGAASEMALMVPAIPQEVGAWLGATFDDGERQRLRKRVHGFTDWRSGGVVLELIARNEQIRALAV